MFWKAAREKYGDLTAEDEDIKKYLKLTKEFQEDSYKSISGYIQDIGHRWIAARSRAEGCILEIGCGAGRHTLYFSGKRENYYVCDSSFPLLFSGSNGSALPHAVCCDARKLPFKDTSFQIVISIYNLEHILDLTSVFQEVHRVLAHEGKFLIALPCEGGFLWNMGRELTTRRHFQKKYGINYDKAIAFEHVHDLPSILFEIQQRGLFSVRELRMFPFFVRSHHANLVTCLECIVNK